MYEPRQQLSWLVKPDNNQLSVEVPSQHIKRVDEFLSREEENIKHIRKLMIQETEKLDCFESVQVQIVNTVASLCSAMDRLSKSCPIIIFQLFNEELRSFKGYTTWMVFHSHSGLTIIDMQSLRSVLQNPKILTQQLKKVFMEERILKVGLSIEQQMLWLQRDFHVFCINVFDLRDSLRYSNLPSSPYEISKFIFQEQKQPAEKISEKMRGGRMIDAVHDHILLSTLVIARVLKEKPQIFKEHFDCLEQIHRKINQKCRRSYHHHYDGQEQLQQLLTNKENIYLQQQSIVLKPRQEYAMQKIGKLHRWREQTAKMLDQSISYILPSKLLVELVRNQTRSILQLQVLYRSYEPHEVSRDHHHTILQILNQEMKQFSFQKMKQEVDECLQGHNDHLKFLKHLGLVDPDWRSNDFEAMKMYKEIISMDTLCPSILEDELKVVQGRTLTNCQLMCIFNYARDWGKKDQIQKHYNEFKEKTSQKCQGCCCQNKERLVIQDERPKIRKNLNYDQVMFEQSPSNDQILKNYEMLAEKQRQQQDEKWKFITRTGDKWQINEKFPDSLSDIYEMANRRKKDIKKVKSKVQEKVEFVMPDINKLYKDLGWA